MVAVATHAMLAGADRWICKRCAYTRYTNPLTTKAVDNDGSVDPVLARCRSCAGTDWHRTTKPIPEV